MRIYLGKLIYNDNAEYILVEDGQEINLSSELDRIYYSEDNSIDFAMYMGTKLLSKESGLLIRKKNKDGFYSYHINTLMDLDLRLFEQVGNRVEIHLSSGKKGVNQN